MHVKFIQQQVGLLKKFASDDPFPHAAEVRPILENMDEAGPEGDAARQQAMELRKKIMSAAPGDHSVFSSVMSDINAFTSEVFQQSKDLGSWRQEYLVELYTYRQKILEVLQSVWLSKKKKSSGESVKELEAIITRIDVWLKPDKGANHLPLPFPTAYILDYVWTALISITEGFKEVSHSMVLQRV